VAPPGLPCQQWKQRAHCYVRVTIKDVIAVTNMGIRQLQLRFFSTEKLDICRKNGQLQLKRRSSGSPFCGESYRDPRLWRAVVAASVVVGGLWRVRPHRPQRALRRRGGLDTTRRKTASHSTAG